MLKRILFFVLFFCVIQISFGNGFYADLNIDVANDGRISIIGDTNYKGLQNITNSADFTSKDKKYWILNITTNTLFDEFNFDVILPKGSKINYIKTTPNVKFENKDDRLVVVGIGEDREFNIIIQYSIENEGILNISNGEFDTGIVKLLLIFLLSGILILILINFRNNYLYKKNDNKENKIENLKEDSIELTQDVQSQVSDVIFKHLNQRQKDIVEIV